MSSYRTLKLAFSIALVVLTAGCGSRYIPGTKIKFTEERQELFRMVEVYQTALEQRDEKTLRKMTSLRYYENASTTTDATDDYDYNGLEKVFAELKNSVRAVKLKLQVKEITVMGDRARVDVEYEAQYLIALGEQDRWETKSDKNRLAFIREEGEWRIISGL